MIDLEDISNHAELVYALTSRAVEYREMGDIQGAIECLESASDVASPEMQEFIRATLVNLCIVRNRSDKIAALLLDGDRLTPELAIGALLLARNGRLGIGHGLPSSLQLSQVLDSLFEYLNSGRYSADEVKTICALLVQLGKTGTAVTLLLELLQMQVEVDEELVVAVLTLARDCKHMADCTAIVDAVGRLDGRWLQRTNRYRVLLGKVPMAAAAGIDDKVIHFLCRSLGNPLNL